MKIKKITGFICAFFIAQLSFGQITLEHTYSKRIGTISRYPMGDFLDVKYYFGDKEEQAFIIYNLDHSIYKTIKLNIPSGTSIDSMGQLYVNMINSDALIELSYTLKYKDSQNNDIYDTYIINENGDLIKKFEKTMMVSFHYTENGNKLWAYKSNGNEEIYSLPTTLSNVPSVQMESVRLPYPNPASQQINIPYQLSGKRGMISIYNTTGQLIEQKNVDGNFGDLLLDVSNYVKGMYYYKMDKQRGEFMVK